MADSPPGPRASFGIRFVAALVDGVMIGVVGTILHVVVGRLLGWSVSLFLLGLAYTTYLEGSPSGQTVGKRAMGIRVVDPSTGGPIGTSRALIRGLGRIVSMLPCLLGYFWMLWDKDKQTWHDKFAASLVVPTADPPVAA